MAMDPMAMARSVQAIMAQAGAWVTQYKSDLAARGLGFTAEDLAAIAASATAHPLPPGGGQPPSADELAQMQRVQKAAMEAVYPENGFAPDDPRLAPVGMPLVAYAVAARAIGWANEDTALVDRVLAALGCTRADYDTASSHWTPMLQQDMAIATLYGQLFAHSGELPHKPGPVPAPPSGQ
jgi:hypothetical protein